MFTMVGMHTITHTVCDLIGMSLPNFGNCHECGYMGVTRPSRVRVKVWLARLIVDIAA